MGKRALAIALVVLGALEHFALLCWAIAMIIYERRHPSDMPFGYLFAAVLFIILATSLPSARWLYRHLEWMVFDEDARLVWTGVGMVVAPWMGMWLHILAFRNFFWFGPLGTLAIFLAPAVGSVVPYLLISLLV